MDRQKIMYAGGRKYENSAALRTFNCAREEAARLNYRAIARKMRKRVIIITVERKIRVMRQ